MNRRQTTILQLALILAAWVSLFAPNLGNDGLWFQGDAPRHAANGLFWKAFLSHGSVNPRDFALQYYARYPVIAPANYPPFFYLLEAGAYTLFHPSPYAARALVAIFALMAALYLFAWLRRWVGEEAGWMAALLLLLPGFIIWSNAVMLNIPAAALSLAALYHARRWIEAPPGREPGLHFYLAAGLSLLAVLTYYPAGALMAVVLAWILAFRRLPQILNGKTALLGFTAAALLALIVYVAHAWAPEHLSFVTQGFHQADDPLPALVLYFLELPRLMGYPILILSLCGVAVGTCRRRWRSESLWLILFFLSVYAAMTWLRAKSPRYVLLLCIPLLCFAAIAFESFTEWLATRIHSRRISRGAAASAMGILCVAQAWIAFSTPVPRVEGVKEAVAFLEKVAPDEPVFFDGYHDGIFTFYLCARDPDYKRQVVLGSKLLYTSAVDTTWRYRAFINSTADVVEAFRDRGGCRWLAIERSRQVNAIPAARLLRKALESPEFELVRSVPASGDDMEAIDIYRFKPAVRAVTEIELPFHGLGEGVSFKIRPVEK